jgi:transcriptional regulator with XRE-family HTH domain
VSDKRNPVDIYVGGRLRLKRTLSGFSQERLGDRVGLTFQQIQKYEKGSNRISASRMFQFARVLDVAPAWFFEGIEDELGGSATGFAEPSDPFEGAPPAAPVYTRENVEVMRLFAGIRDAEVRERLFELIRAVAARDAKTD